MFDRWQLAGPAPAGPHDELPLPTVAPPEPSAELGAAPGPVALAAAMSCDPASMSDTALLDVLDQLERTLSMAAAVRARLIHEYASRAPLDPASEAEQWLSDGHREQLATRLQTSCHEADVRCDTAVALFTRLPATRAALRSGSLPWAQAVALARETRDLLLPHESAAVERIVLADPRAVTVRQVTMAARRAVALVRPPAPAEVDRRAYVLRSLQFWPDQDGTTALHAVLTTDAAAVVARALEPLAVRAGTDDDRTAEQRRADAFVQLAVGDAAGSGPAGGAAAGDSAGRTGGRLPDGTCGEGRISVRLMPLARTDPQRGIADGSIDGAPITPDVLRRLTCDATLHLHPVDRDGTIGAEQARQRLPGAAMRRRLEARDQGCAFVGCHVPARCCHAHHIRHWSDGGPTVDTNMILMCSRHHHLVHDGGWTLTGPSTHLVWTAPDGHRYERPTATATVPPWPDTPPWPGEPALWDERAPF